MTSQSEANAVSTFRRHDNTLKMITNLQPASSRPCVGCLCQKKRLIVSYADPPLRKSHIGERLRSTITLINAVFFNADSFDQILYSFVADLVVE